MKVDFNRHFKTLGGEAIADGEGFFTLKKASTEALLLTFEDEKNLGGEDKAKRGSLAMKIYSSVEITDMSVEEVALVKKLIGKAYSPLIVKQAWDMLENSGG